MEGVLFWFLLDKSCVSSGLYSLTTEILATDEHGSGKLTNQSLITESIFQHEISNLLPGTMYHYCVVFSSTNNLTMKMCGDDLPDGGVFTTAKPHPPDKINGAVLVSAGAHSNQVTYSCLNDLESFDDGSVIALAEFDADTQMYSINGSCTSMSNL